MLTACTLGVFAVLRRLQARVPLIEPLNLSPHSSGESTPNPLPESAIWSPFTPAASSSPRSVLPPYLRTPTSQVGPIFRASRPATPVGSPLFPPVYYSQDEEDETMYPIQYATRLDGKHGPVDEEWSPGHNRISSEPLIPHFTSAPGLKLSNMHRRWSWSWTFVFRGRRRRMTIRAPTLSWSMLNNLMKTFKKEDSTPMLRHRVLRTALMDVLGVFWPAVIVWGLLTLWML